MKILDRYLAFEMLGPFFVGIMGFVMVMTVDLLFTFVDLIINKGIPLFVVLKLLLFKLPSILILTFPVASLFGIAMCLGRLSHENELSAMSTSGISFRRIIMPLLLITLFISGVSFFTNEKIVPYANQVSEDIIRQILMRQPLPDIRENIFFKDPYNRYFYIRRADSKTNEMEDVMVYELSGSTFPQVVTAKKASFKNMELTLMDGTMHRFDENGKLAYEADFKNMSLNLKENPIKVASQKSAQEMDSSELKGQISLLQKGGVPTNALQTDFFLKFSVPLTSFIFALIGIPLAIPGIRSNRTWGLVLTIVIMFTFYVFASVFRSLGRGAVVPPFFAAWTPQIIFGILGVILLIREVRTR